MTEYEGLTPCGEVDRWRRRFWLSALINLWLAGWLVWLCR